LVLLIIFEKAALLLFLEFKNMVIIINIKYTFHINIFNEGLSQKIGRQSVNNRPPVKTYSSVAYNLTITTKVDLRFSTKPEKNLPIIGSQ